MSHSSVEHVTVTQEEALGTEQKGCKVCLEGWQEVGWWRKRMGMLGAKKLALNLFRVVSRASYYEWLGRPYCALVWDVFFDSHCKKHSSNVNV